MTKKSMLKRVRTQLIAVVESPQIDVGHRITAAGILLKTYTTESMPRNISPPVREAMVEAVS